jgi:hypothetical protein
MDLRDTGIAYRIGVFATEARIGLEANACGLDRPGLDDSSHEKPDGDRQSKAVYGVGGMNSMSPHDKSSKCLGETEADREQSESRQWRRQRIEQGVKLGSHANQQ